MGMVFEMKGECTSFVLNFKVEYKIVNVLQCET